MLLRDFTSSFLITIPLKRRASAELPEAPGKPTSSSPMGHGNGHSLDCTKESALISPAVDTQTLRRDCNNLQLSCINNLFKFDQPV